MEAVVVTEGTKGKWERFVAEHPDTIAWQSYDWSSVLRKHYRFDFYPLAVYDGVDICGILPLYHLKTRFSGNILISVPYAVAGGIASEHPEARSALLEKAKEISARLACPLTLKQYKLKMEGDLALDANYYNRELRLTADPDAIWSALAERNREMIAACPADTPALEYPSRDVAGFFTLLSRHLHGRGIPCVRRGWIEDLLGFNMYSIALLRRNGVAVAGTLVKEFKKTVSFPFTCLPPRGDEAHVYRLYWELIRHFCLAGKEIFHSGRIPNNDLTDPYRLGWGGERHGYFYQYYPPTRGETEFSHRRGGKRALFEKCWKLMPSSVAEALGPYVVERFP